MEQCLHMFSSQVNRLRSKSTAATSSGCSNSNSSSSGSATLTIGAVAPAALVGCFIGSRVLWTKWKRRNARFRVAYVREQMVDEQLDRLLHHTSGVTLLSPGLRIREDIWSPVAAVIDMLVGHSSITASTVAETPPPSTVSSPASSGGIMLAIPSRVLIPLNRPPPSHDASTFSALRANAPLLSSACEYIWTMEVSASLMDLTQQHRSSLPIVDSTFLTSYAELFTSGIAPLDVLVDTWNVLSSCLHQYLIAIAVTDAISVAEGGTGELVSSWDCVLATAEVLLTKYNILHDKRIITHLGAVDGRSSGEGPLYISTLGLWVLPLSKVLVRHVVTVVRYRQSLIPAMQQTLQLLKRTCSMNRLCFLGGIVLLVSCSRSVIVSLSDAMGESQLRGVLDRTLAQASSDARESVSKADRSVLSAAVWRISNTAVRNLLESLRRMLRNASISVVCGAMLAAAEVQLTNHMVDSIEADIVMSLSIQNMGYITGNRIKYVIGALNSVSTFAAFLVDFIERTTRNFTLMRSGARLPLVMILFVASQRLQSWFSSNYTLAQIDSQILSTVYTAPSNGGPTKQGGNNNERGDHHAHDLFELPSLEQLRGDAKEFVEVDAFLLAAAMNDEDHNESSTIAAGTRGLPSLQAVAEVEPVSSNTNRLILKGVLANCVESPHTLTIQPQHGLSLLVHVSVCSNPTTRASTQVPPALLPWTLIGPLVLWPPTATSALTVEKLRSVLLRAREGGVSTTCDATSLERLEVIHHVLIEDLTSHTMTPPTPFNVRHNDCSVAASPLVDDMTISSAHQAELVKMPRITHRLIEDRRLLDSLRLHGLELDVVKACVLSDALALTSSSNTSATVIASSVRSLFSLHWLTTILAAVEDVALRLTALWVYDAVVVSDRELSEVKSVASRVESMIAPYPSTLLSLSESVSRPGRKPGRAAGVEGHLRRHRMIARSMERSDLARNSEPFSVLNNALSVKRHLVDRPMAEMSEAALGNPFSSTPFCVEFRNVSKSFGHKNVLKDVTFTVDAGSFVGIVGVSGAGKTTVLQLLLRIFDPDEGSILINGRPISEFPVRMLRRRVAYVCQDFKDNGFFKEATISTNLALGDVSHEDMDGAIDKALELADATQVVAAKPLGKETIPEAKLFSGGEIQRLVVARAQMRKPEATGLLILDEATSALDGATEQIVMNNLLTGRRGGQSASTCIAVAHRLATLTNATKILVLDDGRIVEEGCWADLVMIEGGLFQQLYRLQMVRGEGSP